MSTKRELQAGREEQINGELRILSFIEEKEENKFHLLSFNVHSHTEASIVKKRTNIRGWQGTVARFQHVVMCEIIMYVMECNDSSLYYTIYLLVVSFRRTKETGKSTGSVFVRWDFIHIICSNGNYRPTGQYCIQIYVVSNPRSL